MKKAILFSLATLAIISVASAQYVSIYEDCNYRGKIKLLATGNYDSYQLGIGNDVVSSIRVPRGYSITLYEDAKFKGRSVTYYSDISCLPGNWNDKASSIQVRNRNSSGGYSPGYNYNSGMVVLYRDCGYSGSRQELGEGSYNSDQLGIGNDELSSLRIPSGMSVTLYQDNKLSGPSITYTSDVRCINNSWNDRVSSLTISRIGGYSGSGYHNNNNNYNDYGNDNAVTLYEDCNYKGSSKLVRGTGRYNLSDIGFKNDALSSIKVKSGYEVTLYEDKDGKGDQVKYPYGVPCLNSHWNDKVSSIYIRKF